jgi:hypothetical protein
MDILDWVMYAAGTAFGLLTLGLGLSRASAFTERDVNPLWWLGFIVFGAILAVSLIVDWILPVETTIYLANGGTTAREVLFDDRPICLPAKSYDDFRWRLGTPNTVTVVGDAEQKAHRYKIEKGTWFINTSEVMVSADMYSDDATSIAYDALSSPSNGVMHVGGRLGRPFRMFSQSSLDRIYSPSGDIVRRSSSGPCAKADKKERTGG